MLYVGFLMGFLVGSAIIGGRRWAEIAMMAFTLFFAIGALLNGNFFWTIVLFVCAYIWWL